MSRFSEPQDPLFRALNTSIGFDYRLAPFDIEQSLAHARMLARQEIISDADLAEIERGLGEIRGEIEANRFEIHPDDEDIHMAIERWLT
jgi:argininosuccinate lyase